MPSAQTLTSRFVIKTFKLPFAGPRGVLPTQILITKGFPRISSFDIAALRASCRMLNRPEMILISNLPDIENPHINSTYH